MRSIIHSSMEAIIDEESNFYDFYQKRAWPLNRSVYFRSPVGKQAL